jgi:peptide/nickel transport system permease protein
VNAIIAISLVSIPIYARIVRASVLSIRELDFVAADRALGVRNRRILWHRVFPNALTPLVVQATLGIATAVLRWRRCRSSVSACSRRRPSGGRCWPPSATTSSRRSSLVLFPGS